MAGPYVMTIAGVTKAILPGWQRTAPSNGQGTMRFQVLSLDGSYVPALDAETILTDTGTSERMFGGQIISVRESGLGGVGLTPIVSEVWARDFNVLATRRYFTGETLAAGTLKSKLVSLVGPYIQLATLDPAQVDGPTLPAKTYRGWRVDAVLDDLSLESGGYVWEIDYHIVARMFLPGTLSLPFNVAAGDGNAIGDVTSEPSRTNYANRVYVFGTGVFTMVEDGVEEALHGIWDLLVDAPDIATQVDCDAKADEYLANSLVVAKTVTYKTFRTGVLPSRTQTITLPTRHINNTFMVTEVESHDVQASDGNKQVLHTVTAIEGVTYQTGWREAIKQWGGAQGGITTAGGIGASTTAGQLTYPMGGSKLEPVRGTGTSWEFAGEYVQIDTTTALSDVKTVYLSLSVRDSGVGVKARLYDVSNSVVCAGESGTVTSLTPQFVSFPATLSHGNFIYKTQVQVDTADRDAFAQGISAI